VSAPWAMLAASVKSNNSAIDRRENVIGMAFCYGNGYLKKRIGLYQSMTRTLIPNAAIGKARRIGK